MFKTLTVENFCKETASKAPTPGGGSIAALNGSLAYSLTEMVLNLSLDKKGLEDKQDEFKKLLPKVSKLRQELLDDIDRDAKSFDEVMKCFKMPKESPEDKIERTAAIQKAYKGAISVPFSIGEKIYNDLEIIEYCVEHGNQNAVTDGLTAFANAKTAIIAAFYNVKINLTSVKDEEYVKTMVEKLNTIETDVENRGNKLFSANKLV